LVLQREDLFAHAYKAYATTVAEVDALRDPGFEIL
jgi:hypothetical protein